MDILAPFMLTPAQLLLYFTVCVGIVVGIVHVIRQIAPNDAGWIRWLPLFALFFGVFIVMLASQFVSSDLPRVHWALQIIIGLIVGLMASGAWSQGKSLMGK